jgi:hypothetical protein
VSDVPTRFEIIVHEVLLATRSEFGSAATRRHAAGVMLATAAAIALADPEWARAMLAEAKDPDVEGVTPEEMGRVYIEITNAQLRDYRQRADRG